ncbi:hypothetical protein PhCBS80983_g04456 [Powellomyces hirtus]|uniref:FAS1 domain-containing protein n=1 Tax=Powellomyces hirtus TaxID=109895 RepID=A0A507DXX9_9FUNG|nr:hypothetical protein PhCBS80983_g04456 [Powellomyces hirtus]
MAGSLILLNVFFLVLLSLLAPVPAAPAGLIPPPRPDSTSSSASPNGPQHPLQTLEDDIIICDLFYTGPTTKHPPHHGNRTATLYDNIAHDPAFTKLTQLVTARPAIVAALSTPNADVTLLAPVNDAFKHHTCPPGHDAPPDEIVTSVLLYHLAVGAIGKKDLRPGDLLDTGLELPTLGNRPQKIRVFGHKDHISLNIHSHIIAPDMHASNGILHGISRILIPPPDAFWVLAHIPLEFGIFAAAIRKTGFEPYIRDTPAITLFPPTNLAFKHLGWRRLKYLFSDQGIPDLREIVAFHICSALVYTPEMKHRKKMAVPTLLEGRELDIRVRKEKHAGHRHHPHHGKIIDINDGEARISIADGIAMNGVLHALDRVLDPCDTESDTTTNSDEIDSTPVLASDSTHETVLESIVAMIIDMDV